MLWVRRFFDYEGKQTDVAFKNQADDLNNARVLGFLYNAIRSGVYTPFVAPAFSG